MRVFLTTLAIVSAFSFSANAGDEYVRGYTRHDGTYVQPHYQTAPDNNPYNNYSTQGNTNPYTGQAGTVQPYQTPYNSSTPYSNGNSNCSQYGGCQR